MDDHRRESGGAVVSDDQPVAFRARSEIRPSRWLRRPVRMLRFDARWADGRVVTDVDLVALMYRRAPADYDVVKRVMVGECPETGTGPWVVYPTGQVIETSGED
jgi:hypothetical protein